MQQHGGNHPPTPTTLGRKCQMFKIQRFQYMVMLHIKIKGNHEFSNMVANILPA